ncbi:MAG: chemotaxis protein CheX [Acidobacteriia bacterium]|nr:chemotaxis protein CheX [Terriglobia bacterium]
MPANSVIRLPAGDLEQIVGSVFSTMLGTDVEAHETGEPVPGGLMTAAVYLAGEWQGALLLHCLPRQACEFAGCYLSIPPPSTVTDDVRDVLGELANMIAGNLKGDLCPGIRISIPSVVDGDGYALRVCGGRPVYRWDFMTGKGPFWLRLVETPEAT